ncbi:MAG: hypothetical protein A2039_10100 [Candidatus Melainabacteria bacterium GWA2_34_9]|nr:MAG: hypothetical protein A2039_10100 [Candidatus Melainabacteria bacterium GWA2_34_9]
MSVYMRQMTMNDGHGHISRQTFIRRTGNDCQHSVFGGGHRMHGMHGGHGMQGGHRMHGHNHGHHGMNQMQGNMGCHPGYNQGGFSYSNGNTSVSVGGNIVNNVIGTAAGVVQGVVGGVANVAKKVFSGW